MGIRTASDSVEEVMDKILDLFRIIKENGSLTGGLTIISYNPFSVDWRVDYPQNKKNEEN